MKISLLRHGEPEGGRIYRGDQDDPLTQKGWQQMLTSTQNKHWDVVVTSPLLRCVRFANHLAKAQNIGCKIIHQFSELGFGDWQGKSARTVGQDLVDNFKTDPINNRPPNGEYLYDFQSRVLVSFKEIIAQYSNNSVLIVVHAGVIRVIKSYLLQLPIEEMFKIQVASASIENVEL